MTHIRPPSTLRHRVLIADDQPGLIATLAAFLDHEREVEIAASAEAAVYDALISRRVYKKSFSHAKAMRIIAADRGRQFDPALSEAFQRIERTIAAVVLDTEDYAI